MAGKYANEQPAGFKNHVVNIAMVGVGGRSGKFTVEALVKGGKHKVTALTRPDSTNAMPEGLHAVKHINYDSKLTIVEALRGQDVLIITMNIMAPPESQMRLIDAAAEAGVKWVIPNEWGLDVANEGLSKETLLGPRILQVREHIEKVGAGRMHWIGVACGFWYEFSLAGTEVRFGFDFPKKEITFFDNGDTKIIVSTWLQQARAVARLLSLKVLPDDKNDKSPYLSQYNDRSVYISSFLVSQRDMLDSVLRVTGDSEKDWKISYEDLKERYKRGLKALNENGDMMGFARLMYARDFYKDGGGDFSSKLDNKVLGLPEEDLDVATAEAVRITREEPMQPN